MKKFFSGLLAILFCLSLSAQEKGSNTRTAPAPAQEDVIKMRAERSANYLNSRFELDESQQAKMMKIQLRVQKNYLEILPLRKSEPEVFFDRQIALAESADVEILKILKEEQRVDYNAMVAKRNEQALARNRRLESKPKPE